MIRARTSALLISVASLAGAARAQEFLHFDFNTAPWLVQKSFGLLQPPVEVPSPGIVNFAARLTSTLPLQQRGTLWYGVPVNVGTGFDSNFTYKLSGLVGTGGEGLAFVIQADPRGVLAVGRHGAAIGYGALTGGQSGDAIANSLVVEVDTFDSSSAWGDPDGSHISVHTRGTADNDAHEDASIGRWSSPQVAALGVHQVGVSYTPGTLSVFFDDPVVPKLVIAYDFASGGTLLQSGLPVGGLNLVGGARAYVGFSASTDLVAENHDITSWLWKSIVPGQSVYCQPGTSSSGCVPVISGNGSPSLSASSGFEVHVAYLEGQQEALIFYGVSGRISVPWTSAPYFSTLCVKAPTQRTGSQSSGGTAGVCDGMLSQDWLAYLATHPLALGAPFSAGAVVDAQGWFRDPPTSKGSNLSAAWEFTLQP